MRRFSLLTAILFAILVFMQDAKACSCARSMSGDPPCQSFWTTPVVFSGRVVEIKQVKVEVRKDHFYNQMRVRFAVLAEHRGGVESTVDIITGQGGGDCGYRFEVDQNYLVYAYKGENGVLSTGICTPTKPLTEATEDLHYVYNLPNAKPVGSLFGGVWEYKPRKSTDEWQPQPVVSGIPIKLEGQGGRYEVSTDEVGKYHISDIVPGEYLLKLKVPEDYLAEKDAKVTIREKGCSVMDFTLSRETSVGGRIIDADGEPVVKLLVDLVPVDEIDERYQKDRQVAELDENGRFTFRGIPPGSYYLGIGLGRWSVVKHSFPKTYYPGTQNPDRAAVVIVTEGQIQREINFRLPSKLAERKVNGIVVYPDGKPVAKAQLIVIEGEYNEVSGVESGEDGRFTMSLLEGLTYKLRAYINLPSGEQRHAEFVGVPAKGKVTGIKIVVSEARGNCAKCLQF